MSIDFITEQFEDIQSKGDYFVCVIIVLHSMRIFSTEDIDYIKASSKLFKEGDVTLLLEADRNSMELPESGPNLDIDTPSPLRVSHQGDLVYFSTGPNNYRKQLGSILLKDWEKAVLDYIDKEELA